MSNLLEKVDLLDHGYVGLVSTMGTSQDVIEDARMSTNGGFKGWDKDTSLMQYLWSHKHVSVFEGITMKVEAYLPIFVIREIFRHRSGSFNEMSARYTRVPSVQFLPTVDSILERARANTSNKQAQGGKHELTMLEATTWLKMVEETYQAHERAYEYALRMGITKELARITMPVGQYSRFRMTMNIRDWIFFCKQRSSPDAQEEIQVFSKTIEGFLATNYPTVHAVVFGDLAK